jgi:phosphatidylglycerol lysyltransferase
MSTIFEDESDRAWNRLPRWLAPAAGALIFVAAMRVVIAELRGFHYHQVAAYVDALAASRVALAVLLTCGSYAALAAYDVLATRYGGHPVSLWRAALASFVSSAVSNTVGLSGLAGGSLRYRLYTSWGLRTADVARVIAFAMVTFWLGFLALAGGVLTVHPLVLPRWLGPALLTVPLGYLALTGFRRDRELHAGRWSFELPSRGIAVAQLAASVLDWLFAAGVFYALLPAGSLRFSVILAAFLAAQLLGVISNLPGGIGVFEAAIFSLLGSSIPASALAGALVAYRAVYYLLPLIVAGVLLGAGEILRRRTELVRIGRGVAQTVSLFAPAVFCAAIFIDGVVLLLSGATPAERDRVHLLSASVPLPLVETAHLAGSIAGAGLLLLARGVQRRLNGAYLLAVSLLAAGIGASLLKGLDYEEATLLALTLAGLVACRREFYRKTALIDEPFTGGWIAAIVLAVASTLWLGLFAYRRVSYSPELWWHFSFGGDAPRFLRASLAVALVAFAFSMRKLLHPASPEPQLALPEELGAAAAIAREAEAPTGYLVLLGDKSLLWNEPRSAFLMYGVQRRSWIAMGDPVGPVAEARELAWRFFEEADRHNGWPVFYQVRADHLPLYVELGLRLLKIGEEARVDADAFTLSGNSRKGLRHTVRKFESDGGTFEIVPAGGVGPLLPELRTVSNEWLTEKNTREKRFSVGFFDPGYLAALPVAVVRKDDRIVAFANVWAGRGELTVDLMRHSGAAPPGVMDFLFVRLIEHAREAGYRWFNLGIAPLSGVEARAQGPLWGRAAALGVEHGGHFYNFQGLRQYKEKFGPIWQPVFLASPGGIRLPLILTDLAALVSGGVRGILSK